MLMLYLTLFIYLIFTNIYLLADSALVVTGEMYYMFNVHRLAGSQSTRFSSTNY